MARSPTLPYDVIAGSLKDGGVVPFFGAAASAVYRPKGSTWSPGQPFMPFGRELARYFSKQARYKDKANRRFLANLARALRQSVGRPAARKAWLAIKPLVNDRVSPPPLAFIASYYANVYGNRRAVNRDLRTSFVIGQPGELHTTLAGVEQTQLYVTTNYDDLLERALAPRRPHTIVDRLTRGGQELWVGVAGGALNPINDPNDLYDLLNDPETKSPSHPIVFKMHGSIDSQGGRNDSYLITEEDYVEFLSRRNGQYIPPYIAGLMADKDILFLGYSLEDWNVRVILSQLMVKSNDSTIWAIVRGRTDEEEELWRAKNVRMYSEDLLEFAKRLGEHLA